MIESLNKTILVEIDIPIRRDTCINVEPGIWGHRINWDGVVVPGSDGLTGYYEDEASAIVKVGSCYVDSVAYTKCLTWESLRLQDEGFLFDPATQTIYFHFDDFGPPMQRLLRLGATTGFCDKAMLDDSGRPVGSMYEDIYYEPRILSVPSIGVSKDPLFFG
ncbi:MAG TPA: hypothetical protein VLM75_07510, partial [Spirochaetota bacterium]|nr:hypothetical protein [Spirochaetota bacterium]